MPDEEYIASDQGTIVIEEERLRESFTQIPNTILRRPDLTPAAKLTYVMLLSYAHQKGSCFPGQVALAQDMGAGERSVRRYLQELQEKSLLQIRRRGLGKTNIYTLLKWSDSRAAKLADQERPNPTVLERPNWPTKNKKSEEQEDLQHHGVVVGELTERGVTKSVAERLARKYPAELIRAKIDLVEWLQAHHPKTVGKNAAGYLRRAIEEDYQAPPDYRSPEDRRAADEVRAQRQAQAEAAIQAEEERREKVAQLERERTAKLLNALRREHPDTQIEGTSHTTESAWDLVLKRLQDGMTAANFKTWLVDTVLVSVDASQAVVVTPTTFSADWLRKRFAPLVGKELSAVLGFSVPIEFIALSQLQEQAAEPRENHQTDRTTQHPNSVHAP